MKQKKEMLLLGLVLIIAISIGYAIYFNISASPIQEASPTPSIGSAKTIAAVTKALTPTPDLTPTMLFIPTLSENDAHLRLLDLLANNGGCRLPCFWGITSNSSRRVEAQTILAPLSGISDYSDFGPGPIAIDPYLMEGDVIIQTSIRMITSPDNDIITYIYFAADSYQKMAVENRPGEYARQYVFNSTYFGEKLSFYMLPHILSELGRPSSVLIKTNPGPSPRGGMGLFYLLLLYPDQGVLIQYFNVMRMSGSNVLGCPANAHVNLELYPSGDSDSFSQAISKNWNDVLPLYRPLEEATSMTIDEFYQTFRQPTDACIETPGSIWPTFEPGGG